MQACHFYAIHSRRYLCSGTDLYCKLMLQKALLTSSLLQYGSRLRFYHAEKN